MNAVNNLILRASVKARQEDLGLDFGDWDSPAVSMRDPSAFGISVISHPMNYTKQQLDTEVIRQVGEGEKKCKPNFHIINSDKSLAWTRFHNFSRHFLILLCNVLLRIV